MNTTAIAAAVAVLIAGAPALASAAPTGPIDVTAAQVQPAAPYEDQYNSIPGLVDVSFVNTSAVPAVEVVFTLDQDGVQLARISDAGTFNPGVATTDQFTTDAVGADPQLTIAEVKFADGSTWYSDQPEARSQAAVSLLQQ